MGNLLHTGSIFLTASSRAGIFLASRLSRLIILTMRSFQSSRRDSLNLILILGCKFNYLYIACKWLSIREVNLLRMLCSKGICILNILHKLTIRLLPICLLSFWIFKKQQKYLQIIICNDYWSGWRTKINNDQGQ